MTKAKRETAPTSYFCSYLLLSTWLQLYPRSDWLFSCNDRVLLAWCPRHKQSVFNLMLDILIDVHVMFNWQLSKRLSTDQCHLTVSQNQVYNSLR